MNYRILSTYYILSLEDKVEPMRCFVADHPILVPTPTENGGKFECVLCSYAFTPGLETLNNMKREIERATR